MTALTILGLVATVLVLIVQRERRIRARNLRWLREGPCTLIGEHLAAEAAEWLEQQAADL